MDEEIKMSLESFLAIARMNKEVGEYLLASQKDGCDGCIADAIEVQNEIDGELSNIAVEAGHLDDMDIDTPSEKDVERYIDEWDTLTGRNLNLHEQARRTNDRSLARHLDHNIPELKNQGPDVN